MVTINTSSSRIPEPPPDPSSPSDLFVCPFPVLYDQQEGHPWTFQGITIGKRTLVVKREKVHLKTGDYTLRDPGTGHSCEAYFTAERKSPEDLIGSVTRANGRFRREHERMLAIVEAGGFACVIVEGNLSAICEELNADGRWRLRNSLLGCVTSWPLKYRVPWFFAGDRRHAEELAIGIMLKWWEARVDMEGDSAKSQKPQESNQCNLF